MSSTFRYIPSAFESSGGFLSTYKRYPKLALGMLHGINTQEKDQNIEVGVLSNAFTEEKDLKEFWKTLEPEGFQLYSDSGGLQVITRGMAVDGPMKDKIYSRQEKHSHFAMAFDEIPLKVVSRGGGGGLTTVALFVDSLFAINGRKTGKNIAEQIQTFKDKKTKSKILFILQGKSFEAIREFAWFAFQEIKKVQGYEDYIGGLALGNTTNTGFQSLSDFLLRYQYELEFLPSEWVKNLHVLGAGSVSKVFSFFGVPEDYFIDGSVVSADATTQTRAIVFGNYTHFDAETEKLESTSAGRDYSDSSKFVTEHIYEYVKDYIKEHKNEYNIQVDKYDDFREHYTQYNDELLRKRTEFENDYEYQKRSRIGRYFWTMSMMSDYLKLLASIRRRSQEYRTGSSQEKMEILSKLKHSLPGKIYQPLRHILEIRNHKEYMKGNESEIVTGHPYTTKLDQSLLSSFDASNPIMRINGQNWITDVYENELIGRELRTQKAGGSYYNPSNTRGKFLNTLPGNKIDTILTLDSESETEELDAW